MYVIRVRTTSISTLREELRRAAESDCSVVESMTFDSTVIASDIKTGQQLVGLIQLGCISNGYEPVDMNSILMAFFGLVGYARNDGSVILLRHQEYSGSQTEMMEFIAEADRREMST